MYTRHVHTSTVLPVNLNIWNLATPDIDVYVDICDYDIEVFFDIEYSNLRVDIDVTMFDIVTVVTKKTSIS
jgi:hypothetical protein